MRLIIQETLTSRFFGAGSRLQQNNQGKMYYNYRSDRIKISNVTKRSLVMTNFTVKIISLKCQKST